MRDNRLKFEVLSHTADLKIRIFGKTKEELFLNAVLAMEEMLKPEITKDKENKTVREVKIKSLDLPALLVDFLSEVLYLNQTKKEIYSSLNFLDFSDFSLEAKLLGRKVDRFGEDIKAVTHHSLVISQKEDKSCEADILFDV